MKLYQDLLSTETYTFSCTVENVPDDLVWKFPISGQSNSKWVLVIDKNGRCSAVGSPLTGVSAGTQMILDDINRPTSITSNIKLSKFKIEKGNVATDWTLAPEDELKEVQVGSIISPPLRLLSAADHGLHQVRHGPRGNISGRGTS